MNADRIDLNRRRFFEALSAIGLGGTLLPDALVIAAQDSATVTVATVEAAQKAGAVTFNYGIFINSIISFVIVAFAVFLLIRTINRLRQQEEAKPTAPAAPPEEIALLREIRDSLKR